MFAAARDAGVAGGEIADHAVFPEKNVGAHGIGRAGGDVGTNRHRDVARLHRIALPDDPAAFADRGAAGVACGVGQLAHGEFPREGGDGAQQDHGEGKNGLAAG